MNYFENIFKIIFIKKIGFKYDILSFNYLGVIILYIHIPSLKRLFIRITIADLLRILTHSPAKFHNGIEYYKNRI